MWWSHEGNRGILHVFILAPSALPCWVWVSKCPRSATAQHFYGLFSETTVRNPAASMWLLVPLKELSFEPFMPGWTGGQFSQKGLGFDLAKYELGEKTGCSAPKALGIEGLKIKLRLVWEWMCTPEYGKVTSLHCIFTASALIPVRTLPFPLHGEPGICKELRSLFLNFHQTFAVCRVHRYMQHR